jgi:fibronectin type 3 domain-containing protein
MKRKALYVVAVVAGALGIATVALRPRAETRTTPRGAAPVATPLPAKPDASPQARLSEDPTLSRAMKCWRVHEDVNADVYRAKSYFYEAEASRDGLTFKAAGHTLSLGAPTLEQADRRIPCDAGAVSRAAFAHAVIDRTVLSEEYLFDNNRVEQLFRIARPVGSGELTVRIPVQSDLGGAVLTIPASTEGKLQSSGLKFTDAEGKVSFLYHTAVAIDAKGEKQVLSPRYEDGAIALAVPAEFMAQAAYPLLVDPFLELDSSASGGGFTLSTGFSDVPAIAIEGGGNPYVVWSERVITEAQTGAGNFEIFLRYWNGFAWKNFAGSDSGRGISNNDGDSTDPSISLEGDIKLNFCVAWQDDSSGNIEIYLRAWDGTAFVELQHDAGFGSASSGGVSFSFGESRHPSAGFVTAITPFTNPVEVRRVPVVAWEDTSAGLAEIWAMAWYPGDPGDSENGVPAVKLDWFQIQGSRSVTGLSNTPNGVSERPRLLVDTANRVNVVWQDSIDINVSTSTYEILYRRFTPSIITFTIYTPDYIANSNGEFYPVSGQVAGSWARANGAAGSDNISSTDGTNGNPSPAGRSVYPAVTVERLSGNIYVAWEESRTTTNSEIWVAVNAAGTSATWDNAGLAPAPFGNDSNELGGVSNTVTPSRTPSISVDAANRPVVVWVEDQDGNSDGLGDNFEIYCRQLVGGVTTGTWNEVGFQGFSASNNPAPNAALGGVSKTFNASLHPAVRVGNGGLPTVVWAEFVNAGSSGNMFEIFARRFFVVEPRSHRVISTDPALPPGTAIPSGGTTNQSTVDIRATMFHETPRASYFEVEVKPITAQFTGTVTATSGVVAVDPGTHLSATEASVLFSGLMNTSYHIRYRGVDDVGQKSPWLSYGGNADGVADFTISAAPPGVPAAPTNLVAGLAGTNVALSWTAPVGGADSYNVFRDTVSGFVPSVANRIATGVTVTNYTDTTVATGTPYFYVVTGVNAQGEGPPSNEATVTTQSAPGAPTGLTAAASGNQVALSWTPPAGGATSYNIYRDGSQIATGQTLTTYTDTGLAFNTTYSYTVRAVNAVGEGPDSNTATVTTGSPAAGGGGAADDEDEACGLLGAETLLALAALALFRRRRK